MAVWVGVWGVVDTPMGELLLISLGPSRCGGCGERGARRWGMRGGCSELPKMEVTALLWNLTQPVNVWSRVGRGCAQWQGTFSKAGVSCVWDRHCARVQPLRLTVAHL